MRFVRFIFSFYFTFIINLRKTTGSIENNDVMIYKCHNGTDGSLDLIKTLTVPGKEGVYYNFSLSERRTNCGKLGSLNISIPLQGIRKESWFNKYGILVVKMGNNSAYRYPEHYCILSISSTAVWTSFCNVTCDSEESDGLCIRKCCPMHQILGYEDNGNLYCTEPSVPHNIDRYWLPSVYKNEYTLLNMEELSKVNLLLYHDKSLSESECYSTTQIERHENFYGLYNDNANINTFRLLRNGNLAFCASKQWIEINETFCVDLIQNFSSGNERLSGDLVTLSVTWCTSVDLLSNETVNSTNGDGDGYGDEGTQSARSIILYHIFIPIASVFLLLVIIVYVLLWDSQNVHGFTILSYICSLFLLYISLIVATAISEGTPFCKVTAVAVHFLFISTFCWLTAINFDIWWKFRHLQTSSGSRHIRKYIAYCTLSCVLPIILIVIGLVIDDIDEGSTCPLSENEVALIAPQYGQTVCAVGNNAQGWYLYFPAGILIGCNAVFFGMTVYSMYKHKKSINFALVGQCTKEDKPINLFFKLFVVMGVSWILEFIGWALRQNHSPDLLQWFNLFLDIVNLFSQAVAIFYIFVCKKRIFAQLWQEHKWLRGVLLIFVKTGCCEIPPDRIHPFTNASDKFANANESRFRRTSALSDSSATSQPNSSTL